MFPPARRISRNLQCRNFFRSVGAKLLAAEGHIGVWASSGWGSSGKTLSRQIQRVRRRKPQRSTFCIFLFFCENDLILFCRLKLLFVKTANNRSHCKIWLNWLRKHLVGGDYHRNWKHLFILVPSMTKICNPTNSQVLPLFVFYLIKIKLIGRGLLMKRYLM